jgi:hypothetical protein
MAHQTKLATEVIHQATCATGIPKAVRVRKVFHLKTPSRFSDHAAFMLGKTLLKDKTLTSLEMNLNRLSQTHQQLLDCITLNRRLEQITLKGHRFGKILVPGKISSDFLEAISMSRTIHQITMYKLEIKPDSLVQLLTSKSLPIRKLEILDSDLYHACPKNPEGIAAALAQHPTIETIAYRAYRSTKAQLAQLLNRPQIIASPSFSSQPENNDTVPERDPPDFLFRSIVKGLPSQSTVRKLILDLRKDDMETFQLLHKALETNTSITKIVWNQPSSSSSSSSMNSLPYSESEFEQIQGYLERNQQLLREQDPQSLWLPENQQNYSNRKMIERVLVEYGRWKVHHPYIAWPSATLIRRKRIPLPTTNKFRESLKSPSVTLHKLE